MPWRMCRALVKWFWPLWDMGNAFGKYVIMEKGWQKGEGYAMEENAIWINGK